MSNASGFQCFSALLNLSDRFAQRNTGDVRRAVDKALSCNRHIHCSQRLQCTWMASELADWLGRRR